MKASREILLIEYALINQSSASAIIHHNVV